MQYSTTYVKKMDYIYLYMLMYALIVNAYIQYKK